MLLISIIAAVFSTAASIPQLLGKTDKLSNVTMLLRGSGSVLWAVYGALRMEYALVIASTIATIVELCLALKTNCGAKQASIDTELGSTDAVTGAFPLQTLSTVPGKHG